MVSVTKTADSPFAFVFRTLWEDLICEGCARDVCRERIPVLDVLVGARLTLRAFRQDKFYSEEQERCQGKGMERLASFSSKYHKTTFGKCLPLFKDISSHLGERDGKLAIFGPQGHFFDQILKSMST